ncbi:MAG: hypothetical protein AUG49_24130 [Catenulispora sp. 13_1_20CM_3_70_7]|nr:MAG: hypothetical protein AUG49_24130 [Catenulispora sp. 13_1_20CM_3_70_7]
MPASSMTTTSTRSMSFLDWTAFATVAPSTRQQERTESVTARRSSSQAVSFRFISSSRRKSTASGSMSLTSAAANGNLSSMSLIVLCASAASSFQAW